MKHMIGFPYFYEEYNLKQNFQDNQDNQNDGFLLFYLSRLSKDEESKFKFASSCPPPYLPVPAILSADYQFSDDFCYHFCNQIAQVCGKLELIPETKSLVLDYNGFCSLVNGSDRIIVTLANDLQMTQGAVLEQAQQFFADKNVVVQASGLQGAVYKVGSAVQTADSASLVAHTISMAKLAGVTGLQILKAQPAMVIALPTTGAMFFYGCSALVGNNPVGRICGTTADILALPMRGIELAWNTYVNAATVKLFGVPTILNLTQTFKTGPGYTIEEIRKYIPMKRKDVVRTFKDWLIKLLK